MAVVIAVFLYVLLQVMDVSTQSCIIGPDLTELTIRNPLGRDVELHCQCRDMNGEEIETWWFSGNTVVSRNVSDRPYSTNTNPSRLIISAQYTDADAGVYTCANTNTISDASETDTITLNAQTEPNAIDPTTCTIVSTNLPGLTIAGGPILIGTDNVIIYCICTRLRGGVNLAVGPTIWSRDNGQVTLAETNEINADTYYRNIVPSPLIIPSFTASHADIYRCVSGSLVIRANATIALTAAPVDPPTNVMILLVTSRSFQITWTAPSSSSNVIGYFISYTTTASYASDGSVMVSGSSTTRHTLNNLEEGTTYAITVQSNSNEGMSVKSDEVMVTMQTIAPGSPPLGVMVTSVDPASLNVSWQPPPPIDHNGMITGYVIWYSRDGSNNQMTRNVNSETARDILLRLDPYVRYSVMVAAVNSAGNGMFSNNMIVRSGEDVPTVPRSLMIANSNDTAVTLSWMSPDPTNGIIIMYQVRYRTIMSGRTNIDTANNRTVYKVTGLFSNTVYMFQVRAFTRVGSGPHTDEITAQTEISGPQNVKATVLSHSSIEVTWNESSGAIGYLVLYTTNASYARGDSVRVIGSANTSYTLNNLEEGTFYFITVQSIIDDIRFSAESIERSITTYTDVPSSSPQNVMVTSIDPASLMVSWEPPPPRDQNGPITYVIQYTRVGSSDMSVNVTSVTTQYTISGLVAFDSYSVLVAARTVNGTGPFSSTEVGRSGEDVPSEPQSPQAVSINSNSITLQWMQPVNPNGVITQYSIQFSDTIMNDFGSNALMGTIQGLSPDTVYMLQLRAHTIVGEGPPANITVATAPGPVSNVTVSTELITSSTLTLTWMEINVTNSVLLRYTVFYLPVSGPYGPFTASNRRKRQLVELAMNFTTDTAGTLMDLNGSVTYSIEVAAITMVNDQELIGGRSPAIQISTSEGVPTAPRDLNSTDHTSSGVTLTWKLPDPPNGLIIQYNISYNVTNFQGQTFYNFTVLEVDVGNDSVLSYVWNNLIQGNYWFTVVASTRIGQGKATSLMLFIIPEAINCDRSSDDNNGVIIALATLLAIAVIGLVVSVVIIVFLVLQRKQSRYAVSQSNVRYSDVKQSVSRDHTIKESTNSNIKPREPEYEAVDNIKPCCDVKMDANPAYQTTT